MPLVQTLTLVLFLSLYLTIPVTMTLTATLALTLLALGCVGLAVPSLSHKPPSPRSIPRSDTLSSTNPRPAIISQKIDLTLTLTLTLTLIRSWNTGQGCHSGEPDSTAGLRTGLHAMVCPTNPILHQSQHPCTRNCMTNPDHTRTPCSSI